MSYRHGGEKLAHGKEENGYFDIWECHKPLRVPQLQLQKRGISWKTLMV